MQQKDKTLFKKCVKAQEAKDATTSTMYANECAQVRKIIQTVIKSQFALEQVSLRLETVRDFGDVATQIVPVVSLVHSVKNSLAGVIPEVSMQLGAIGETLDSLVLEVGEATGQTWDVMATGEEAEKILNEATTLAKQRTKDRFPDLPTTEKDIGTPSFEGP
jgi:division protein CdvB (Snf7/Vps24/ESCRT-III family)